MQYHITINVISLIILMLDTSEFLFQVMTCYYPPYTSYIVDDMVCWVLIAYHLRLRYNNIHDNILGHSNFDTYVFPYQIQEQQLGMVSLLMVCETWSQYDNLNSRSVGEPMLWTSFEITDDYPSFHLSSANAHILKLLAALGAHSNHAAIFS